MVMMIKGNTINMIAMKVIIAYTWAETYGFKLKCFRKEIDIDD